MTPGDTRTGAVLEAMILPSLDRGGYCYQTQVDIGERPGGGRHKIDVLAERESKKILISLKWQQVSGKPSQYDDLSVFIDEQDEFRRRVNASQLPHTEIDVSDGDLARVCDEIVDWMGEKRLLGYYE